MVKNNDLISYKFINKFRQSNFKHAHAIRLISFLLLFLIF